MAIYPAYDGTEPLEVYKHKQRQACLAARAEELRQSPMAQARGTNGEPLYRVNDRAEWVRTKPLSAHRKKKVRERDGYACVLCGSRERLEVDHIVRYIDGGSNEMSNLRLLCRKCHGKRSRRP